MEYIESIFESLTSASALKRLSVVVVVVVVVVVIVVVVVVDAVVVAFVFAGSLAHTTSSTNDHVWCSHLSFSQR